MHKLCILFYLVGVKGLEPSTSRSQSARSSQLSYTPMVFVPGGRIELPTRGFSVHCSTTELPRLGKTVRTNCFYGGPEESRTPDLRRAKAALYQLSYGPIGLMREQYTNQSEIRQDSQRKTPHDRGVGNLSFISPFCTRFRSANVRFVHGFSVSTVDNQLPLSKCGIST